jgi:uncharacterized protein (TIGR02466 family)
MKSESEIIPAFPTPISVGEINISGENKEKIIGLDFFRLSANNGDMSKDKYVLDRPELSEVKREVISHVNGFVRNALRVTPEIEFNITNSWVMRHHRGDWAPRHFHNNSLISGIVYIKCDELSGDLILTRSSTHINLFPPTFQFKFTENNLFNSGYWEFTPKENQIFLFPSHLDHEVKPSNSDRERICVAFNVWIKGTLNFNTDDDHEQIGTLEIK